MKNGLPPVFSKSAQPDPLPDPFHNAVRPRSTAKRRWASSGASTISSTMIALAALIEPSLRISG